LYSPLIQLKREIGTRPAERAWLRSKAALDALYKLTRDQRVHASMSLHPSVSLAGDILDERGLAKKVRAHVRLGLPSQYLDRRELRARSNAVGQPVILASVSSKTKVSQSKKEARIDFTMRALGQRAFGIRGSDSRRSLCVTRGQ
jgi:hypothetical protein